LCITANLLQLDSLTLLAALVLSVAYAQEAPSNARAPRYVDATPYDAGEQAGWISLFDGQTLTGWEGQIDEWRVENGAIVSSDRADNPVPKGTVYLYWKGGDAGQLGDFELKTDFRLEGEKANSGVQFRAALLGRTEKANSEWGSFGYQADLDFVNVQTGALIECCAGPRRGPTPRPFRALMGSVLRTAATERGAPSIVGIVGQAGDLKRSIRTGDWNQLHLIARGPVLMYYINGSLMSVVIDDHPTRRLVKGRLAIQLEGNGDRKVSFRNLWLKTYP
jgi:hypothetical protein